MRRALRLDAQLVHDLHRHNDRGAAFFAALFLNLCGHLIVI
jgi:hypothetical protein